MRQALHLASAAARLDEVPVGALIVQGDRLLAQAHNLRESRQDPLAHAEVLAIAQAAQVLGSWRLLDCTLYVTLEPCPMCLGAAINARIPRIVYGARDPKAGACGSVLDFAQHPSLNHAVKVTGGVMDLACAALLTDFFRMKRNKK